MTEKEKNIEQGLRDLQEWMLPLQKQFNETGDLNESQLKQLFAVRDLAKGIKAEAKPASLPAPKAQVHYMEMSAKDLAERLGVIENLMIPIHHCGYIKLRRLLEADPTGVSLPWDTLDILRRLYATYIINRK